MSVFPSSDAPPVNLNGECRFPACTKRPQPGIVARLNLNVAFCSQQHKDDYLAFRSPQGLDNLLFGPLKGRKRSDR